MAKFDASNADRLFVPEFDTSVYIYPDAKNTQTIDILRARWYSPGLAGVLKSGGALSIVVSDAVVTSRIQTVPLWLKQRIASYLTEKLRTTVSPDQVYPMPYSSFMAAFTVNTRFGEKQTYRTASAAESGEDPIALKLCFDNKEEAVEFHTAATTGYGVSIEVRWTVGGAVTAKEQKLHIGASATQSAEVTASLFGDASEVYVTRTQLNSMAQQVSKNLNIEEIHDEGEQGFGDGMVEAIARSMMGSSELQEVPIDVVAAQLSAYGLDFNPRDLAPNIQKVLDYKQGGVSSDAAADLKTDSSHQADAGSSSQIRTKADTDSKSGGLDVSIPGIGGGGASGSVASTTTSKSEDAKLWNNEKSSASLQASSRTGLRASDVAYRIEGNSYIPKSLKVAKLSKATWQKGIDLHWSKQVRRDTTLSGSRVFKSNAEPQHSYPPRLLGRWHNTPGVQETMEWHISVIPIMPDGPRFEVKKIKEPHFHGHIEVQANGALRLYIDHWPLSLWAKIEVQQGHSVLRIFDANNAWQPFKPGEPDSVWYRSAN